MFYYKVNTKYKFAHFRNKIFLIMELFIQKEGQLDLTKVFKNGYFTKLDTYQGSKLAVFRRHSNTNYLRGIPTSVRPVFRSDYRYFVFSFTKIDSYFYLDIDRLVQ